MDKSRKKIPGPMSKAFSEAVEKLGRIERRVDRHGRVTHRATGRGGRVGYLMSMAELFPQPFEATLARMVPAEQPIEQEVQYSVDLSKLDDEELRMYLQIMSKAMVRLEDLEPPLPHPREH